MLKTIFSYVTNNENNANFTVRIRFFFTTFMIFITVISFMKSGSLNGLLSPGYLSVIFPIEWIKQNEPLLCSMETLYLDFQFFIFILLLVALKTKIYQADLLYLFKKLISLSVYILLGFQILKNMSIINTGIYEMLISYTNGGYPSIPALVMLVLNLLFLVNIIMGYFFRMKE